MRLLSKMVPFDCFVDIFQIDYNKLYSEGFRIILFDLDNTISKYKEADPSIEAISLMNKLKAIGFLVIVLSNNKASRIKRSIDSLKVLGFSKAKKPLKYGYKRVCKYLLTNHKITSKQEIIAIGDQILTDVFGANRMGIKTILVNPIHPHDEKWYTKFNRKIELRIIKKLRKNYQETYEKIMKCRG